MPPATRHPPPVVEAAIDFDTQSGGQVAVMAV
jgi:hypothetical protein